MSGSPEEVQRQHGSLSCRLNHNSSSLMSPVSNARLQELQMVLHIVHMSKNCEAGVYLSLTVKKRPLWALLCWPWGIRTGTLQGIGVESRELEVYSEESDDQPWTIITCGWNSFFTQDCTFKHHILQPHVKKNPIFWVWLCYNQRLAPRKSRTQNTAY